MSRNLLKSLLLPAILVFSLSCQKERKITSAFYYWKSPYRNTPSEQALLKDLGAKKLYIKFFDVQWDARHEKPFPYAKVQFDSVALRQLKASGTELVPVIFITNETLDKIIPESINKLGERVYYLLSGLLDDNLLTQCKEVQIDCDWTEETKDKYFELLRYLKMLPKVANKQLSVAIHLNQLKNFKKTGIPPANKGFLMCFNTGTLTGTPISNSILDNTVLPQYIEALNDYPLPLDLALPISVGYVLFRNNESKGLINNLPDSLLLQNRFTHQQGNGYVLSKDTIWNGYDLKIGDEIRKEQAGFQDLLDAVKSLSPKWQTPEFTVAFYHLDSTSVLKFNKKELDSVYRSMYQ